MYEERGLRESEWMKLTDWIQQHRRHGTKYPDLVGVTPHPRPAAASWPGLWGSPRGGPGGGGGGKHIQLRGGASESMGV